MHLLVFNELNRMRVTRQLPITEISAEKTVLLGKKGREWQGRFDFLVLAQNRNIGVEVLTRPSHGKLKAKLPYANEVDEFIFVLPAESMHLYQKPKGKVFHKKAKLLSLGSEFADPKLKVWLFDAKEGKIAEKGSFRKLFNVKG